MCFGDFGIYRNTGAASGKPDRESPDDLKISGKPHTHTETRQASTTAALQFLYVQKALARSPVPVLQ